MYRRKCGKCHTTIITVFKKQVFCPVCTPTKTNKNLIVKKCEYCSCKFASSKPNQKYCCQECANKSIKPVCKLDRHYFIKSKRGFVCERCGQIVPQNNTKLRIHAHHKKPIKIGGEDIESNIVILCTGCHAFVHRYPKLSKGYIDVPDNYIRSKLFS